MSTRAPVNERLIAAFATASTAELDEVIAALSAGRGLGHQPPQRTVLAKPVLPQREAAPS